MYGGYSYGSVEYAGEQIFIIPETSVSIGSFIVYAAYGFANTLYDRTKTLTLYQYNKTVDVKDGIKQAILYAEKEIFTQTSILRSFTIYSVYGAVKTVTQQLQSFIAYRSKSDIEIKDKPKQAIVYDKGRSNDVSTK